MSDKQLYEVYIKGGSWGVYKVLFEYEILEYAGEKEEQKELFDAFNKLSSYVYRNDILAIKPCEEFLFFIR